MHDVIPLEIEAMASKIVGAAYAVHRALGPGLLESVYEICLCYELRQAGLAFERQVVLPVVYKGLRIDTGLKLDILVESAVIVELKAVESLLPVHQAQLLTYLKLSHCRLGFLINFCSPLFKDGLRRMVN